MIELPPEVRPIVVAWVIFAGACVGSFLNVVIARVPAGESVVRPRSRCPRCRAAIGWRDNLPVVSWLLLRGRCRACAAPISIRYPIVEALGAGAALAAFLRHGFSLAALAEFTFVALLLALSAIDLDTWLLPHALTWPLIALGLGAAALGIAPAGTFRWAFFGAGVGFAVFAAVALFGEKVLKKEAMGWGDVWLLGGLGAWLGLGAILPVVLLASIQGSIVGVLLILIGKAQPGPAAPHPASGEGRNDEPAADRETTAVPEAIQPPDEDDWVPPRNAVPFGPFLALGALEWLWFAKPLVGAVPLFAPFVG